MKEGTVVLVLTQAGLEVVGRLAGTLTADAPFTLEKPRALRAVPQQTPQGIVNQVAMVPLSVIRPDHSIELRPSQCLIPPGITPVDLEKAYLEETTSIALA